MKTCTYAYRFNIFRSEKNRNIKLNLTVTDSSNDSCVPILSDIHQFNQIKPDPISSLGLIHTNLASIGKHFDDLNLVLSLLKFDFHIIGISEHKIQKENDDNSFSNINLEGYHPFVFDPTETSHGGT